MVVVVWLLLFVSFACCCYVSWSLSLPPSVLRSSLRSSFGRFLMSYVLFCVVAYMRVWFCCLYVACIYCICCLSSPSWSSYTSPLQFWESRQVPSDVFPTGNKDRTITANVFLNDNTTEQAIIGTRSGADQTKPKTNNHNNTTRTP